MADIASGRFKNCEDSYHTGYSSLTVEEKIKFGPSSRWKARLNELSEQFTLWDGLRTNGYFTALRGYESDSPDSEASAIFLEPEKFSSEKKEHHLSHYHLMCHFIKSDKSIAASPFYQRDFSFLDDAGLSKIDRSSVSPEMKDYMKQVRLSILAFLSDYEPLCSLLREDGYPNQSDETNDKVLKKVGVTLKKHEILAARLTHDLDSLKSKSWEDYEALSKRYASQIRCRNAKAAHRKLIARIAQGAAADKELKKINDALGKMSPKTSLDEILNKVQQKNEGKAAQSHLN